MFNTLRQTKTGSGHGPFVLESATSPFARQAHGISRLACVSCRSKKVKCTGEEHGCRRCLERQIECSYASVSRQDTETTTPRRRSCVQPEYTNADGAATYHRSKTTSVQIPAPNEPTTETHSTSDASMAGTDLLDTNLDFSRHLDESDMLSMDDNPSLGLFNVFQGTDFGRDSRAVLAEAARRDSVAQRSDMSGSGDDMSATAVPMMPPLSSPRSIRHTECDCLGSELLSVYETVEERLTWPRRVAANNSSPVSPISMASFPEAQPTLLTQKEILKSCEKWLSRDASRIQSRHVILMVSIFDGLLASIIWMLNNQKGGSAMDVPGSDPASYIPPSLSGYHDGPSAGHPCHVRDLLSLTMGSEQSPQNPGDDEENVYMLRSLLNFRVSRLKGLLERLWAISASSRWLVQAQMVKSLLDRLARTL
ncbi:hypothetical protein BJ166DRAFT_210938 [Pestalotiopsis sp. NC0098]|nr:hypothetical protein BJ166DRAFT_210938 [Pestalotiopsis sp. NC0098]